MTLQRAYVLLAVASGLMVSGQAGGPIRADEGGHDHDAMKAEKKIASSLAALSAEDRKAAEAQRYCPLMVRTRLGSSGKPIKVTIDGKAVFLCCKGCVDEAKEEPQATLKMAKKLTRITANLAKLSPADRAAAEAQKYCAVQTKGLLGTMGPPAKVMLDGKPAFLCCGGCKRKAKANPSKTLATVEKLKHEGAEKGHHHDHKHKHKH